MWFKCLSNKKEELIKKLEAQLATHKSIKQYVLMAAFNGGFTRFMACTELLESCNNTIKAINKALNKIKSL